MGQLDLYENYFYIDWNTWNHTTIYKQMIIIKQELLLLFTWNYWIACKLLVLDRNTWNHITVIKPMNILNRDLKKSLRVFRLLSSSLLLFPQHFSQYILRPSSGVCQTLEPSRNFELRPLLNPRESPVPIPLAITGYKC